jgi:AraC-like DNA-binding protein/mannose-6-phosphate isomerase-like protein (cupin superfamily)
VPAVLLPSNDSCVLVQMSARTLREAPAYRRMSRHSFDGLAMSRIASVAQSVTAHLDEVPARQLESVQVQLVHSGRLILEQADRQVEVRAGELVVYDASRPFSFVYPQEFRTTIVQIPTLALGVTNGRLHSLSAAAVPRQSANAGLLAALLTAAAANDAALSNDSRQAVSRTLVDAVRLVAHEHAHMLAPVDDHRVALASTARSFVAEHLNDPSLSAAVIAARLHVSVRALHAAFEDEPETLGQAIRRQRLEAARTLLATTSATVRTVAEGVGYLDVTHFIRLFKNAEGVTPAQWRRRQLGVASELHP